MTSRVLLSAVFLLVVYLVVSLRSLYRNFKTAQSSGFQCTILPTHLTSVPWLLAGKLFLPFLDVLPSNRREQWIP